MIGDGCSSFKLLNRRITARERKKMKWSLLMSSFVDGSCCHVKCKKRKKLPFVISILVAYVSKMI